MPVLADFIYPQGAEFAVQRQYVVGYAIGWQGDAIALASGRYTVLKEFSFGGYELHIRVKSWIWAWDNRGFTLADIFEDYYAIPPGGGSPVSAGDVFVKLTWDTGFDTCTLVIANPAPVDHYYFQRLPAADRPYWTHPFDGMPATPFWYP